MQAEDKPGLDKRSPEVDFNHVLLSKRNEYYMPNSDGLIRLGAAFNTTLQPLLLYIASHLGGSNAGGQAWVRSKGTQGVILTMCSRKVVLHNAK
jgi:hypothetical protein